MGALLKIENEKNQYLKPKSLPKIKKNVLSLFMFIFGLIMSFPFIYMIAISLTPENKLSMASLNIFPSELFFGSYQEVFANKYYFKWYLNSIITVLSHIALRFLLLAPAAYAFARLRFKGRDTIFLIILAGMLVTPDTTIVARFFMYKWLGLTDTILAIIIPNTFLVFFFFLLRQFFMTVPFELSEAALIDGCSHFRIYWNIILPLSKPIIVTMALFTFVWTWNNFVDPYIFITSLDKQLLSVGLTTFQSESGMNYSLQMAGAAVGIIPSIILFTVGQGYFIQGIRAGGVKG